MNRIPSSPDADDTTASSSYLPHSIPPTSSSSSSSSLSSSASRLRRAFFASRVGCVLFGALMAAGCILVLEQINSAANQNNPFDVPHTLSTSSHSGIQLAVRSEGLPSPMARTLFVEVSSSDSEENLTAAELLEKDVIAAGGAPLASSTLPCSFSFHSAPGQSASLTVEPQYDPSQPPMEMQNLLEWMVGVYYAKQLNLQYVWTPPFSPERPTYNLWSRFLGLAAGELTVDDLNQRLGEGSLQVQGVEHKDTHKEVKSIIEASVLSRGLTTTPLLFIVRRPQQLDSRVACVPSLQRIMRQKYCAARALRPVPFSLYAPLATASHPTIHIAVQIMSSLPDKSGTGPENVPLSQLPGSMEEYLDTISITITQLLAALRRHTHKPLHVHLFSDPPLKRDDGAAASSNSPLFNVEKHPLLKQIIQTDSVNHPHAHGIQLTSHFYLSQAHTFHHLVMADILVTGWNFKSLLAATLNEGLVFVPALPHVPIANHHAPTWLFDLPVCSERSTTYQLRHDEIDATSDIKTKQAKRFRDFFAAASETEGAISNSTDTELASSPLGNGILMPVSKPLPTRFEMPVRRVLRRRAAEAHVLEDVFAQPPSNQHKPHALLMRHCQAIPEPISTAAP